MRYILLLHLILVLFNSSVISQNNKWVVTMTKESGYNGQEWITKTVFPESDIIELWGKNYKITNLTYGEGKWTVVMSKESGLGEQTLLIRQNFPESEIQSLINKDFIITGLTFGQNNWVVVMSSETELKNQYWISKTSFPLDEIQNASKEGYNITNLAYGNSSWIAVISKKVTYQKQNIINTSYFPESRIKEYWKIGWKLSSHTYFNRKWSTILCSGTNFGLQSLVIRGYFPKMEIKKLWVAGYRITDLSYGLCSSDNTTFETQQPEIVNTTEIKSFIIDTLVPADSSIPKIWTVIVGIAKYNHYESLNYSDDDAYRIYAFFKSPEGGALPDNNIQILVDESATRANILKSLNNIFNKAKKNDVIIFYFSGHGIKNAFLPYDYDGTFNLLMHQEIIEALKNSPAKHKICIADACHSGNLNKRYKGYKSGVSKLYSAFLESSGGTALLMSSKAEENSIEFSGLRQGVFSYYLIEGLKGEADIDKNRIITIREIYSYIYTNVRNYTNQSQNPNLSGSFDENMPVGIVR